jgi:DNA-directed RNA polymerase subunit K/omega
MTINTIESYNEVINNYNPSKNTSRNIMSKFEMAKLIGLRLEQLARGCVANVDTKTFTNIHDIARAELIQRKMPFMIVRTLPNGIKEYFRLEDMIINDVHLE